MLEVDVSLSRGEFALEATFAAPTPGVTALFGRSGSGKTTVINLIAGLLLPDRGRIALDGAVLHDTSRSYSLPPQRRAIGYVFQDPLLFGAKTLELLADELLHADRELDLLHRRRRRPAPLTARDHLPSDQVVRDRGHEQGMPAGALVDETGKQAQ